MMPKSNIHETTIRDSLVQNLNLLEEGLTYLGKESRLPNTIGTTGFVDILAQDSEGRFALVEVKRTTGASREALHEVLKYLEAAKRHLGLRENEIRIIIAAVEWNELRVPFSSFCERVTCMVDGFELHVDSVGTIQRALRVAPTALGSGRVIATWHELRFYLNSASLTSGLEDHEMACATKRIESYVLVILGPPVGCEQGAPSTKQMADRRMLAELFANVGQSIPDVETPLYQYATYFAMQQLTRDEYIECLGDDAADALEAVEGMDEDETLGSLHEALLASEPIPDGDYREIGYPAKFRSRLLEEEGWEIIEVRRHGSFKRNTALTDETIIGEICGSQGNSLQTVRMSFRPSNRAEIAEATTRISECLRHNAPWRSQILYVLSELEGGDEHRTCRLSIFNPSCAIATLYLASAREDWPLFVPTYTIAIPEHEPEEMYFGLLESDGSDPATLRQIVDDFYDGSIFKLMMPLNWGGFEHRDVEIMARLGLRYRTLLVKKSGGDRTFFELRDHEWQRTEPNNHLNALKKFEFENETLFKSIHETYSSRWDGHSINFQPED